MNSNEPFALNWRTSSYSSGNGQCVEVASAVGAVATRDSKDPNGPALTFPAVEWLGFIKMVKARSFPST
ncbi:DUF397 domain-containing protein [Kitasatospora sp. NBC_01287]|uniref:DUF397 domain-containing protein n=1 Tax=Kitasatospora sp. NBC_01287 TaxID=2903573 RepID=UPI00225A65C3|nr:DUF397 domain-containing protein [Kitasatospora sp. NBC_01287]MCX4750443.1 DUF397 domain-containing protein [Kitasatospora sp. NBC_01287]